MKNFKEDQTILSHSFKSLRRFVQNSTTIFFEVNGFKDTLATFADERENLEQSRQLQNYFQLFRCKYTVGLARNLQKSFRVRKCFSSLLKIHEKFRRNFEIIVILRLSVVGRNNCRTDLVSACLQYGRQGWRQKFSDRGAGASDRGAKMTEKWCFCGLFCQISSDENPEFSPTGGLDASDGGGGGAVAP